MGSSIFAAQRYPKKDGTAGSAAVRAFPARNDYRPGQSASCRVIAQQSNANWNRLAKMASSMTVKGLFQHRKMSRRSFLQARLRSMQQISLDTRCRLNRLSGNLFLVPLYIWNISID